MNKFDLIKGTVAKQRLSKDLHYCTNHVTLKQTWEVLCSLHLVCSPNETLARKLKSTQLVAQMLYIPFNMVANTKSTKLSVKPISNWRAVISAQTPVLRVRSPKCNSTEPLWAKRGFYPFNLAFFFSVSPCPLDSAALCIKYKTHLFIKSQVVPKHTMRLTHRLKHNCITVSREDIKQNST